MYGCFVAHHFFASPLLLRATKLAALDLVMHAKLGACQAAVAVSRWRHLLEYQERSSTGGPKRACCGMQVNQGDMAALSIPATKYIKVALFVLAGT